MVMALLSRCMMTETIMEHGFLDDCVPNTKQVVFHVHDYFRNRRRL